MLAAEGISCGGVGYLKRNSPIKSFKIYQLHFLNVFEKIMGTLLLIMVFVAYKKFLGRANYDCHKLQLLRAKPIFTKTSFIP